MALQLADRVQQTGTANTTVSFNLSGSVSGYQSFSSTITTGNTTYYAASDGTNWEVGIGTLTSTTLLTRTTILASSNSGSAVTFSGTVNVFVTYPSEKSVNLDGSNNVSALGTIASGTWQGSTVGVAYGGSGQTTAQTAMNAFAGAVTSGSYLRGNGTNVVMNTIQAADVPTLNQNTIGTASNVTGTVAVANGGTGSTTGYGLAKAWVNFNGTTGAINGTAFNVSSVTKNASGNYSINFTTAMPNANYAGSFCGNGLAQIPVFYSPTTGYLQTLYYDTGGIPVSPTICVATIFST